MSSTEEIASLRAQYDTITKQQAGGATKGEIKKAASALAKALNDIPGTRVLIKRNRSGAAILADISTRLDDYTIGSPETAVGDDSPAASVTTDVGGDSPDDDDDVFFEADDDGREPEPEPLATPRAEQTAGWVGAAWSAAKTASGLLGVQGATEDVSDAQRLEQDDRLDESVAADYTTAGVSATAVGPHTVDLDAWADDTVREIRANRGDPDNQAAIAGAAIEALHDRSASDAPSPHEAIAVGRIGDALSEAASAPSPVRDALLQRVRGGATSADFVAARRGLMQQLGQDVGPQNLDPKFSSVSQKSIAVGSPTATGSSATQVSPVIARGASTQTIAPAQQGRPAAAAAAAAAAPVGMAAVRPPPPPIAARAGAPPAVFQQQQERTRRAVRDTTAAVRAGTANVTQAIADAASRGELTAQQLAEVEDNLKDAPLTAQMVAQGRLKPLQALDAAEVASYEQALNNRRVKQDSEGREAVQRSTRLAAQPMLTRYVEDARTGGKRYQRPRFAGPAY